MDETVQGYGTEVQGQAQKTDLTYDASFEKKISRLFIFRGLWMFLEMWVIMVWAFWMNIIIGIHFWYMLILGRRSQLLWEKQLRFMRHLAKWQSYLQFLTDKRPDMVSK